MKVYINAKGTRNDTHVNCRAEPNIDSKVEWYLTTVGVVAEFVKEENDWRKYKHGGREFWIHKTFHDCVELKDKLITTEYVSQNDPLSNRHPNDCGIASIATLMKYVNPDFNRTVNQLAIEIGLQGSNFTNFGQLITLARNHGYQSEYVRPLMMSDVLSFIYDDTPVLCLVNYDKLIRGKRYGHFLIALGIIDEDIITHDPNTKAYMRYNIMNFAEGLAQLGTDANMPFQGLYLKGKKK